MRKIVLASVAAFPLLALAALPASAQDIKKPGGGTEKSVSQPQGGSKAPQGQAGATRPGQPSAQGGSAPGGRAPSGEARRIEGRTVGQGQAQGTPQGTPQVHAQDRSKGPAVQGGQPHRQLNEQAANRAGQASKGGGNQISEARGKANQGKPQIRSAQKEPARTTGQATNRTPQTESAQPGKVGTRGQAQTEKQPGQVGTHRQAQTRTIETRGQVNRPAETRGQAETRATVSSRGRVTLNEEQRTRIRQTVLEGRDVPRVDRVDFAINVGRVVPSHVRVVAVPTALIDIHPEWRSDEFFVANDEIIIVDRGRRIVAMMPVGTTSSAIETRGTRTVGLESEAEIREVQQVLIERGFYHGPLDGVMGRATREALMVFQRREGIQATGRIDERTMSSLRISGRTVGTAGERQEPRAGNLNRLHENRSGLNAAGQHNGPSANRNNLGARNEQRPSTSGQGASEPSGNLNKPNVQGERKNQQRPSTSGQGGKQSSVAPSHAGAGPGGTSGQSTHQRRPSEPGGNH
jgi:hypothetical protein